MTIGKMVRKCLLSSLCVRWRSWYTNRISPANYILIGVIQKNKNCLDQKRPDLVEAVSIVFRPLCISRVHGSVMAAPNFFKGLLSLPGVCTFGQAWGPLSCGRDGGKLYIYIYIYLHIWHLSIRLVVLPSFLFGFPNKSICCGERKVFVWIHL